MAIKFELDVSGHWNVCHDSKLAGYLEASWHEYVWKPFLSLRSLTASDLRAVAEKLDQLTVEREAREEATAKPPNPEGK